MSSHDKKAESTSEKISSFAAESATNSRDKFTPGPWTIERETDSLYAVNADTGTGRNWKHIGLVKANNEGSSAVSEEEAAANAALIAAAPDLLAALEQIVGDWHQVSLANHVPDEINDDGHWDAACAAIAKAKGGA